MITHYRDLLGSELRLNTKTYRRQSAVRRGVVTGIGDLANQESLYDAAVAIKTDLGEYHPEASSLPLQNISIRRIGADRAEYAAEYGVVGGSFNDQSRVTIADAGADQYPALIPWASEVASGRRWTPNEYPPFYSVSRVSYLEINVTTTLSSTASITSLVNDSSLINKVNNAAISIRGVTYPAQSLMFRAFASDYDPTSIASGVDLTYQFIMRRFSDADGNVRGWVQGGYEKVSSRPYWQPVWIPLARTADFSSLPGI